MTAPRTLNALLAEAERRIERHAPQAVRAAMETGALLIDIRSAEGRARDGIVPGSLHIPRTVLEWRLAPGGEWRNPFVGGLDEQLILIDIRSAEGRARDGIVPGSLHIPRTVLEWRLAPGGEWRNPFVGGLDEQLILICDHGCSTILAAATLADLGYTRAGDVIGGFEAWRAAGLPMAAAPLRERDPGELSGMRGPD